MPSLEAAIVTLRGKVCDDFSFYTFIATLPFQILPRWVRRQIIRCRRAVACALLIDHYKAHPWNLLQFQYSSGIILYGTFNKTRLAENET